MRWELISDGYMNGIARKESPSLTLPHGNSGCVDSNTKTGENASNDHMGKRVGGCLEDAPNQTEAAG